MFFIYFRNISLMSANARKKKNKKTKQSKANPDWTFVWEW